MARAIGVTLMGCLVWLGSAPTTAGGENPAAALSAEWAAAWSAADAVRTAALYADDAAFLPSTGERVSGKASIQALFKGALAKVRPSIRVTSHGGGASGALAYDSGEYEEVLVTAEGRREVRGSYAVVGRRESDGRWKIVLHMWSDRARSVE